MPANTCFFKNLEYNIITVEEFDQNQNQGSAVPNQEPVVESHLADEIPRPNKFLALLKNLLVLVVLVGVILASFWVSFNLGKQLLIPVKRQAPGRIQVAIPEPPASIAKLQKLNELGPVTKEAADQARLVKVHKTTTTRGVQPAARTVRRPASTGKYYKVQAGFFTDRSSALDLSSKLKASGFETFVRKLNNGWRVQAGAYTRKFWAQRLQRSLKAKGFDSMLVYE